MAHFEGTIVESMRFIGGHPKIMVWSKMQKHPKIGKCEECSSLQSEIQQNPLNKEMVTIEKLFRYLYTCFGNKILP